MSALELTEQHVMSFLQKMFHILRSTDKLIENVQKKLIFTELHTRHWPLTQSDAVCKNFLYYKQSAMNQLHREHVSLTGSLI